MKTCTAAVWAAAGMALGLGGRVLADCPPPEPGSPGDIGSWQLVPGDTPVFIVHGCMLPTGKLLLYAGEVEQNLPHNGGEWDPRTGEWLIRDYQDDIFCAGQASLPDGRVLVAGGSNNPGEGITATNVYDPWTHEWTKLSGMEYPRWYPCLMTRPDGKMMVMSGTGGGYVVEQAEVWDPAVESWSTLPVSADKSMPIYPSLHMMPDGRFLYSGTSWSGGPYPPSALFDPSSNTWNNNVATHIFTDRTEGFAFLVPPQSPGEPQSKVCVVGGYGDNQRRAEIIDLNDQNPQWRQIADTSFGRNNCNGVILPDGTVALTTGIYGYKWDQRTNSYNTEIFDPKAETWKICAAMTYPGQYHSVSLLLPDGRVMKAGGHDGPGVNLYKMEIFSPPYLFRGDRPVIEDAPDDVGYGRKFTVTSAAAETITRVNMIRLSGITHHTNPDQRLIPLTFKIQGKTALEITAPGSRFDAPPGYYMLFILNECGVPSEAKIIQVHEAPPCYADFNGDGTLDLFDFLAFVSAFNAHQKSANCSKDESFDLFDFLCFSNAFNQGC